MSTRKNASQHDCVVDMTITKMRGLCKSAPAVCKSAPVVCKSAPAVCKSAPAVCKSAPVVCKSAPAVFSEWDINYACLDEVDIDETMSEHWTPWW